ncbi:MAG: hypothetical protein E6G95_14155 [Alphaproteobacteria bacterium]|jgi:hypothetical protein|nr:MAG: hypothetical protein E6G95_14155 [Alphaproteobacteria bacterium]
MKRSNARWTIGLLVAGGLLLVAGANAHLVYVAVTSQPDCLQHVRSGGDARPGQFSVAKSAC